MHNYRPFLGGALIVLIVLAVLAIQPLTERWLVHSFKNYLRKGLGIELHIAEIHHKDGNLVIPHPLFTGALEGEADQIILHYNSSIFNRELSFHLTFENPRLSMPQAPTTTISDITKQAVVPIKSSIFKLKGSFTIPQGQLTVHQPGYEASSSIGFNLSGEWESTGNGHYTAQLQTDSVPGNGIWIDVKDSISGEQHTKITMKNADAPAIAASLGKWISLDDWVVTKGSLNGQISLEITEESPPKPTGQLTIQQLALLNPNRQLAGFIPEIKFSLNAGPSLTGHCVLSQPASIASLDHKERALSLSHFLLNLSADQQLQLSAKAKYTHKNNEQPIDLAGSMDLLTGDLNIALSLLEWNQEKSALITLKSKATNEVHYDLEVALEDVLIHPWPQEKIFLHASLHRQAGQLLLEGTLTAFDEQMPLGATIEHSDHQVLSHLHLKSAWVQAKEISLGKHLDPFLKPMGLTQLEGSGDFLLTFNENTGILQYTLQKLALDSDPWSFATSGPIKGEHYFDWNLSAEGGVLYLSEGVCTNKTHNIVMDGMRACLAINRHALFGWDIEGFCNGIFGIADLKVAYQPFEPTTVDIHAHTLNGKVSEFQELVAKFQPKSPLTKIPLEGEISLRQEGGDLHLAFDTESITLQGSLHGELAEGRLQKEIEGVSVQELSCHFDCTLGEQNQLLVSDIQGTLLAGPVKHVEEYLFAGDHLHWSDHHGGEGAFDIWVGDRNRDIVRLVGQVNALEGEPENLSITLNTELTHLGDLHPQSFNLVLHKGSEIKLLDLKFDFDLNSLLRDFQRLSRTEIFPLSRRLAHEMDALSSVSGAFQLALHYDNQTSLLSYNVKGNDFTAGEFSVKSILLEGKKRDRIWTIDQLKLDDLSLAAEFLHVEDQWRINFLGLRNKEALLIGLEGDYFPQTYTFEGKINLLEANLSKWNEWPYLSQLAAEWNPIGELKAAGKISVSWAQVRPKWRVATHLNGTLRNFSVKGTEPQNMDCSFECDSKELRLATSYKYQEQPYQLVLRAELPRLSTGDLQIFSSVTDSNPLVIRLQRDLQKISIQRIHGTLNGITTQLQAIEGAPNTLSFSGEVIVDPQRAVGTLSHAIEQVVNQWQIGGEYHLQGKWNIGQENWGSWQEQLSFSGSVEGKECKCKLGQWDHLYGLLDYTPTAVNVRDLVMDDSAGTMAIPIMDIAKQKNANWQMTIPHSEVKELQIANLRTTEGSSLPIDSNLTIHQFELDDFSGDPFDISTWQGKGTINWEYPETQKPVFALLQIPEEIFAKTGLDLAALSPSSGTVQYEMEESRIYLTRFKDTYSKGKLSKFTLAKRAEQPSYIDFDGNIFVQLRMKQYNLMFKLAELFTVTIQGPLTKPTYTILKQ